MPIRWSPVVAALAVAIASSACASQPRELPARPSTPQGWRTVVVESGDLRMALPPWLVSFDTSGALFANEQPAPGVAGFLQLMAEGPRTAEPQPAAGQSLDLWLTRRVDPSGGAAWPARLIDLPSGSGVLIEQVVRADRPRVWRVAAYAVRTRAGVAYLLIDGPPGSWAGREADAALIPMLMELGPGS